MKTQGPPRTGGAGKLCARKRVAWALKHDTGDSSTIHGYTQGSRQISRQRPSVTKDRKQKTTKKVGGRFIEQLIQLHHNTGIAGITYIRQEAWASTLRA